MASFVYRALDEYGNSRSGAVDAESRKSAREILTARGLVPERIDRRHNEGFSLTVLVRKLTPVRPDELVLYTKQLGTMLRVGVPIVRTLEIMAFG